MNTANQRPERSSDPPEFRDPKSDPRLEIPEVLRKPIDHPSLRQPKKQPSLSGLGELGKALAIGLDFLFSIAAGGVLGWLIDRWLGSSPVGLLIGIGLGFGGGTFRMLQRLNAAEAKERNRRERTDGPSQASN
ncbi:MAG: AtpZ/AtpI family protein [Phycisphaeraceae bacterium]|nr:AtpZ/AtpI family protein [Phycisphaeraceae bacterium]